MPGGDPRVDTHVGSCPVEETANPALRPQPTHRIDGHCARSPAGTIGTYCLGPRNFSSLAGRRPRVGCVSWMSESPRALERKVPPEFDSVMYISGVKKTQSNSHRRGSYGTQAVVAQIRGRLAVVTAQAGGGQGLPQAMCRKLLRARLVPTSGSEILPRLANVTVVEQTRQPGGQAGGRAGARRRHCPRNVGLRQLTSYAF